MSQFPRWLRFLCLASLLWAFSFGLGAPLASLWLQDAGCDETFIGLNTGVYYLGIAVTACVVPGLMRRWGRRCLVIGFLASGVTVASFPWSDGSVGWFLLRALNGFGGALSLIPLETCVNQLSGSERRAQNFGFYAFSIALGWALGNVIGVTLYADLPRLAFFLGGAMPILGVIALWGLPRWIAVEEMREKTPLEPVRNFLSFGSAWSQGFLEGGMVGFLPMYLLAVGLSLDGVGWMMGGLMIGVILFQVPVAWMADRWGRTRVLLGCYSVAMAGMVCLMFPGSVAWLAAGLFAVGACSGAFYPLGLALLGERLPAPALARGNAWYLGINCIGSVMGPVAAGVTMRYLGPAALFVVGLGVLALVLVAWGATNAGRSRFAADRVAPSFCADGSARPAA